MIRSGFVVSLLLIFSTLLFFPGSSFADTWEYVTYNGFDPAVKAWTRVALIFSDVNYKGLFFGVIILGALAIYLATYVRMAVGARIGNGLTWTVPVLIGAVMYIVFIQPKDKLVIYDEAQNRGPVTIDDIPRIVALPAGMLNKIERGFTNIVNTSSDPASSYRLNAGGIGWELIDTPLIVSKVSIPLRETLNSYIKNCVYLEITRNGTNLDITKIANGEQDLLYVINQSANSVWYTISYLNSQSGEAKTCSEVAPLLVAWFSQATLWESGIRATCAARGFDVQNVASYNACKSLLLSSVNAVYPNTDLANTFRQALFAHAITEVASSDSPAVMTSLLATRQTQSQFIGLGIHANSWIPVLKSSLTAVAVGITPVLLLFVATPLIGRALSLTLGMFVWLSMWGVIDSIIHGFGYDLAQQASAAIKSSPDYVGVQDMFLWPGYTAKVAATFGALRWAGLMLASVITGMLIKFGGTALAMLAGSISGMPQSSGAAYGRAAVEPGGVLSSDILPTMTWSNAAIATGGLSFLTRGLASASSARLGAEANVAGEVGFGNLYTSSRGNMLSGIASGAAFSQVVDRRGLNEIITANVLATERRIGSEIALGDYETARTTGYTEGRQTVGKAQGDILMARALGFNDLAEFGRFKASGSTLDRKTSVYLNKSLGTDVFEPGMRIDYGVDSNGNINYVTALKSDVSGGRKVSVTGSGIEETRTVSGLLVDGKVFTGTTRTMKTFDGRSITTLSGELRDPKTGGVWSGEAFIGSDGRLVRVDGSSGAYYQDRNRYVQTINLSGDRLRAVASELRKAGLVNAAAGIEEAAARGHAVAFTIEKDPVTRKIAQVTAGTGARFSHQDFRNYETGWRRLTEAFDLTRTGKHTEIHDNSKRIVSGIHYEPGNDVIPTVVTGDPSYFHKTYGQALWTDIKGGSVIVKNLFKELESFGNLKAKLQTAVNSGVSLSFSFFLGNIIKKAGAAMDAEGRVTSVDNFDVNKFYTEVVSEYYRLFRNPILNKAEKTKIIVNTFNEMYNTLDDLQRRGLIDRNLKGIADAVSKRQDDSIPYDTGETRGIRFVE